MLRLFFFQLKKTGNNITRMIFEQQQSKSIDLFVLQKKVVDQPFLIFTSIGGSYSVF